MTIPLSLPECGNDMAAIRMPSTPLNPDFPYGRHCAGANQRDLV
jgi:hypothetical protein